MNSDTSNCNQCSASIEFHTTTNFVTCGRCKTPLIVRRTETSIYTEQTPSQSEISSSITVPQTVPTIISEFETTNKVQHLAELQGQIELNRLQNELTRLDFEWDQERKQYVRHTPNGGWYTPETSDVVLMGFIALAGISLAIFVAGVTTEFTWDLRNKSLGAGWMGVLFGTVVFLFGFFRACSDYKIAKEFERAHESFQKKRIHLLAEIDVQNDRQQ